MALEPKDLAIVIDFLADTDPEIVDKMCRKLFDLGPGTVEQVLASVADDSAAHREASRVMRWLKAPRPETALRTLLDEGAEDIDLEAGLFALAHSVYPEIERHRIAERLDRMAADTEANIVPSDHPIRIVRALNTFLFGDLNFRGKQNYDKDPDPDLSFINRVLDRRTGIPISLSSIYLLLARRLDLPIVGVDMPMHFILRYDHEYPFYIDPFNSGRILTASECGDMIGKAMTDDTLPIASNLQILIRTTGNLFMTYTALGDEPRAESMKSYIDLLQGA
jgi:regulator of sirC expression with transglutaminase-like and TPR domain